MLQQNSLKSIEYVEHVLVLGFDNCSKNLWNNVNFLEGNFRSEREPGSLSRDALRNPVGGTWGVGWGGGTWDGTPGAQRVRGRL